MYVIRDNKLGVYMTPYCAEAKALGRSTILDPVCIWGSAELDAYAGVINQNGFEILRVELMILGEFGRTV